MLEDQKGPQRTCRRPTELMINFWELMITTEVLTFLVLKKNVQVLVLFQDNRKKNNNFLSTHIHTQGETLQMSNLLTLQS